MCSTVLYKYSCGHSALTTYKCKHCPPGEERCPPVKKRKRPGGNDDERGEEEEEGTKPVVALEEPSSSSSSSTTTSFQRTKLDEPCHPCSGGDKMEESPTDRLKVLGPLPVNRDEGGDGGQGSQSPVGADVYRWRAGILGVRPLVSSRLANALYAPPASLTELLDGIRRFLMEGGSVGFPDGSVWEGPRVSPRL